ncbi:hypothetical protein ABIF66_011915 [Bradyrhizobium japonicum]|nr:hypothetical protein [Bradyrhizobium japonicum]MCP1855470.1 hypothetical protein [Bradyrhizobium japonicum]MCP1897739.1 hypothetical protein [Bradyrhizobium japonicum]MCW2319705.1 hypothetical protein [Bradyrhizobium japonicum]
MKIIFDWKTELASHQSTLQKNGAQLVDQRRTLGD